MSVFEFTVLNSYKMNSSLLMEEFFYFKVKYSKDMSCCENITRGNGLASIV